MDSYQSFAEVYDMFMDNVPYDAWCELYCGLLEQRGVTRGLMAELGCGTGQMTRRFEKKGFDMIGIDASIEMLDVARGTESREKLNAAGEAEADEEPEKVQDILYLWQDMRSFELYGTVAAIVSVCDCLNYILEEEDLLAVFRLVNNYLDPGGVFAFDMNTPFKYETELADRSFCESREEAAFLWENDYDPESRINEYDLTLFVRADGSRTAEAFFRRFVETHFQRAWCPEEVSRLLGQAGLRLKGIYGEDGISPLTEKDGRMYFVAQECMK